jgi:hemoglobin/transferrin/lactoferrin receptor protein
MKYLPISRMILPALPAALLSLSLPGYTQQNDSEANDDADATRLAPVVVVGTRHPRTITDVASTVSLISEEEIQQRQIIDLTDLVREEPGVSVDAGDSRFGAGGFRIRGIGGNRVLTLIDQIPIADRFFVGSYADSGRDYLDTGMISRVEILRGPASVLYGSQALGGVVSMHTLSPADLLRYDNSHNTSKNAQRLLSGYRGDRDARFVAGQSAWGSDRNGFLIAVGARRQNEREPGRIPDNSKLDRSDRDHYSALLKQQNRFGDSSTVTMTLDVDEVRQDTDIRAILGTGRFANTTEMLADDSQSRWRASLHHEWLPGEFTRMAWRAYSQQSEVEQNTRETRGLATPPLLLLRRFRYEQNVHGVGMDLQQDRILFGTDHLIGLGLDIQAGKLVQQRDALQINLNNDSQTNVVLGETFPLRDFPITRTVNAGVYLNDEIRLPGTTLIVIPGLRYDFQQLRSERDPVLDNGSANVALTNQDHDRLTGNLGLRWPLADGWSLYAQYAQGFRAPPASDVNLALNIDTPSGIAVSLPNPDLKPETSDSYEIGIRMEQQDRGFNLALFDNRYDDFIQSRALVAVDTSTTPVTRTFQSININEARIYGAELRYRQPVPELPDWSIELGAEWLRGVNRSNDQPLTDVGPPKAVIALSWAPRDAAWSVRTVSTLVRHHDRVDDSVTTPYEPNGYAVHDLTTDYRIGSNWTLRGGIFNLTDRHYFDWSAIAGRTATDPLLPYLAGSGRHASITLQGTF